MKPTIRTDQPPYRVTRHGTIEIRCPRCERFHVEYTPITPGAWFRWRCRNCGDVTVTLPDDSALPEAA